MSTESITDSDMTAVPLHRPTTPRQISESSLLSWQSSEDVFASTPEGISPAAQYAGSRASSSESLLGIQSVGVGEEDARTMMQKFAAARKAQAGPGQRRLSTEIPCVCGPNGESLVPGTPHCIHHPPGHAQSNGHGQHHPPHPAMLISKHHGPSSNTNGDAEHANGNGAPHMLESRMVADRMTLAELHTRHPSTDSVLSSPNGSSENLLDLDPAPAVTNKRATNIKAGGKSSGQNASLRSRALGQYKKMMQKKVPKQHTNNLPRGDLEATAVGYALEYLTAKDMPLTSRVCRHIHRICVDIIRDNLFLLQRTHPTGESTPVSPQCVDDHSAPSEELDAEVRSVSLLSAKRPQTRKLSLDVGRSSMHGEFPGITSLETPPMHGASNFLSEGSGDFIESTETLYDGELLMDLVYKAMDKINVSATDCESPRPCHWAAVAINQGKRAYLEDSSFLTNHFNELCGIQDPTHTHSFYAVFDGHNGLYAANYAKTHLFYNIGRHPDFANNVSSAIHASFLATDQSFNAKAEREQLNDGTTAVVVLIRDETMYVANVGDSHAVLCQGGVAKQISTPQTPKRADEEARIRAAGGAVVWFGTWRVNGSLAVSRSIGDPDYKGIVIAEPEILVQPLQHNDEFIILASDGIWDVMNYQEAVDFIRTRLVGSTSAKKVSESLVAHAITKGSQDNITVLLVVFNPLQLPPPPSNGSPSSSAVGTAAGFAPTTTTATVPLAAGSGASDPDLSASASSTGTVVASLSGTPPVPLTLPDRERTV